MEKAQALAPDSAPYFSILGYLHERARDLAAAKEAYRQALSFSVSDRWSLQSLLELAAHQQEKQKRSATDKLKSGM